MTSVKVALIFFLSHCGQLSLQDDALAILGATTGAANLFPNVAQTLPGAGVAGVTGGILPGVSGTPVDALNSGFKSDGLFSVLNPTFLGLNFGLPAFGQSHVPFGVPFPPGKDNKYKKPKPRKVTCAQSIEMKKGYGKSVSFLALTLSEKNKTDHGHVSLPQLFHGLSPFHGFSDSPGLELDLQLHTDGAYEQAKVVFTTLAPILSGYQHHACHGKNLGYILKDDNPYQSGGKDGVVATLSLKKGSTSTVHTDTLPFRDLRDLAGRGAAVVLSKQSEGVKLDTDILICCRLAYDHRKRTLHDAGMGSGSKHPADHTYGPPQPKDRHYGPYPPPDRRYEPSPPSKQSYDPNPSSEKHDNPADQRYDPRPPSDQRYYPAPPQDRRYDPSSSRDRPYDRSPPSSRPYVPPRPPTRPIDPRPRPRQPPPRRPPGPSKHSRYPDADRRPQYHDRASSPSDRRPPYSGPGKFRP